MVLACSVALSGCEHVGSGMHDIADGFKSFGQDFSELFVSGESGEVGPLNDTSALNMTTGDMAQYMSGGSVEVYGLDGAPAGNGGGPYLPADNAGTPYSGDSSVMVYPMDGGGTTSPVPPGMMPPSGARQDYPSPFVDHSGFLPMGSAQSAPGPQSMLPPADMRSGEPARIYFDHNSSSVNQAGKQVVGYVAQSASGPLAVEGHASARAEAKDPVARHMTNLKVSMDRALSVSRELMQRGVPAASIKTSAFGDTRPASEGEAASRRVEIYSGTAY